MERILVIHGAGFNMRGKAQIELFGEMTISEYDEKIKEYASTIGVTVELFHSNLEGEVINRLYAAHESETDGAIINPAGYMGGASALVAAIRQVNFPTIEVHVSNPSSRGAVSNFSGACKGVVAGFGVYGYYLALKGIADLTEGK